MNGLITTHSTLPPAFVGSVPTNVAELRSLIAKAKEAWLAGQNRIRQDQAGLQP